MRGKGKRDNIKRCRVGRTRTSGMHCMVTSTHTSRSASLCRSAATCLRTQACERRASQDIASARPSHTHPPAPAAGSRSTVHRDCIWRVPIW